MVLATLRYEIYNLYSFIILMAGDLNEAFSIRALQDYVAIAHDLPAWGPARLSIREFDLFPYRNL
jgi:hypothetical protein